ncbi:uncharacterized protein LOC117283381 [Fukomys damarensis]|uniref:uncharacterized protein LOC117283381 n=1 Tax=Fukomys damarensis TaxID=885580 RepID=UPI0014553867|nr:uncharacterized protein LOC117283381 [Fukomys damarensis]
MGTTLVDSRGDCGRTWLQRTNVGNVGILICPSGLSEFEQPEARVGRATEGKAQRLLSLLVETSCFGANRYVFGSRTVLEIAAKASVPSGKRGIVSSHSTDPSHLSPSSHHHIPERTSEPPNSWATRNAEFAFCRHSC